MIRALAYLAAMATSASAGVLEGDSADPLAELNAFYAKICQWDDGTTIPYETVDITHDGTPDYLLNYDLSCRGQANAFAGTAGMARQIWVSLEDGTYLRILDVNARDLQIETREDHPFVILQHVGSYCMTADAAPCFLTLEYINNQLIWAPRAHQHPSMTARLDAMDAARQETAND